MDFFNRYLMTSVQIWIGFHFYTKFIKKKATPVWQLLFAISGAVIIQAVQAGNIVKFVLYVLLLSASGWLLYNVHNKTLTMVSAFRFHSMSIVLYAIITAEIMQLMFGIFNSILCILYPLTVTAGRRPAGILFMLLGYLSLPAAMVCYSVTNRFFSYDETINNRFMLLFLTPALMIFFIGEYINSAIYGNTIVTDNNGTIIGANHYQMLIIQIFGIASLFCVMFSYKKLLENFHLNTQLSLLEQEERSLNQYVTEAKNRYEKTKSFRHDIKNHLTVLKKLIQEEKTAETVTYMGGMEEITEELSFPYSTNHPIADILIENKLGLAKNIGIDSSCSLTLPYPCSIRDIDFAVILSNALDNAIAACKRMPPDSKKYIRVSGKIQGDFILLEVENSFQETESFQKGTGILNIQTIAEKYQGAVNIRTQDNVFILSVLLIIPQHSERIPQQIG